MKSIFTKTRATILAIMIVATHSLLAQQSKNVIQSNFVSPFGQKQNTEKQEVIKPIDEKIKKQVGSDFKIEKNADYSMIRFSEQSTLPASDFFNVVAKEFDFSDQDKFNLIKKESDEIGFTHYRYEQTFNGVSVFGSEYLLHEKDGILKSANGTFYKISVNITPNISKENAIQLAIKYTSAEKYLWNNSEEEAHLKLETNDPDATYYPSATLIIAPVNGDYDNKDFRLCYKINIASEQPYNKVDLFIDAHNGSLVNKLNKIAHADVQGTGNTLYSGTKSITMDSYGGGYRLRESARPIQTYNMKNGTSYANASDFSNSTTTWGNIFRLNSFTVTSISNSWWYTMFADEQPDIYIKVKDGSNQVVYQSNYVNNTFPPFTFGNLNISMINPPYTVEVWDYDAVGGDDFGGSYTIAQTSGTSSWSGNGNNGSYNSSSTGRAAIDAHWAVEKTYDYFLNTFGRNSFDNQGGIIKSYIHYGQGFANGYWDGSKITLGDGDGLQMSSTPCLDFVAHEFTHGVVQYTANLAYQGESGALNESFADIFGTAVEFFAGNNPNWTIFESITLVPPFYWRSLSNPNSGIEGRPDTYLGNYWHPTSNPSDNGGVHSNSGVQNYWFYLLSQGGSGTNDIGNAFSVTGIGINQASQIAYRNLRFYLSPNSNYLSSYYGSLQAAEDLYGANSTQQNAVRAAWYAVGIGTNPNGQCSGTVTLSAPSGTFTDGSGSSNYQNNLDCRWLIQPTGANTISLNFTSFNTEANYDTVIVYDGPTTSDPVLMTWWGTTLPPTINSSAGALLVRFRTDNSVTAPGWSATYSSSGTAYCDGGTLLTNPTGSFTDGSGANNYGNNQLCYWLIAPPCATSVTLSFSQFNTEAGYDGVIVFNGNNTNAPVLLNTSGTTIPPNVTANSGQMLVVFVSDYAVRMQGFSASYTSTGSPYCSGTTTLNSTDWGIISDGSGSNNYCNNMDCRWLIQPLQATSITFNFIDFDVEPTSTDGLSIYDAVEIYDGTNTSAPLLGRYSGNTLPPSVTSTGGSMYIRFFSDVTEVRQGWSGYYTSTQAGYCSGTTTLTAPSGSFSDGSGVNNYGNNADCKWLIQPPGATQINLSFTAFDTELNYDGVIVYDGNNTSAPQLGTYSGNTIPPTISSTGGALLVHFLSDIAVRNQGWNATYNSVIPPNAPVANFSTSNTNICISNCINFTDNSTNSPTSWNWSFPGGNPSSSNAQNPTNICYNTAGTFDVILTSSNSGGSNTKTMNGYITVNPQPTIPSVTATPSTSVCQGETITLNVSNPCSGCNYTWIPSSQTGASISVNTTSTITVNAANGCGQVTSNPINVNIHPLPPTPTITVNGNQLISSAANGNQWYLDGSLLNGETSQTILAQQSGNYHVVVTDGNNCSSESASVSMTITGIGEKNQFLGIAIYPNPTSGIINIQFSKSNKEITFDIFDVSGKQVFQNVFKDTSENEIYSINISDFANGVYQLRINSNGVSNFQRLVLTK